MNTQHVTPATKAKTKTGATFAQTLEQEAVDLGTLHAGLVRHLEAWRSTHEAATLRVAAVTARIDAAIERIEAKLTQR